MIQQFNINPYESPSDDNNDNKRKDPILDLGLAIFAFAVLYVPFIIMIILQILIRI